MIVTAIAERWAPYSERADRQFAGGFFFCSAISVL